MKKNLKKLLRSRLSAPSVLLGTIALGVCTTRAQAPRLPAKPVAPPAAQPVAVPAETEAQRAKRIRDAEAHFRTLLAVRSDNPFALAGMGAVRIQQRNYMGAISYLEQAALTQPRQTLTALDTARYWFFISEGRDSLGANDLTVAERRYLSALELRPNSREAYEGLRVTLLKARRIRRAGQTTARPLPALQLVQGQAPQGGASPSAVQLLPVSLPVPQATHELAAPANAAQPAVKLEPIQAPLQLTPAHNLVPLSPRPSQPRPSQPSPSQPRPAQTTSQALLHSQEPVQPAHDAYISAHEAVISAQPTQANRDSASNDTVYGPFVPYVRPQKPQFAKPAVVLNPGQ